MLPKPSTSVSRSRSRLSRAMSALRLGALPNGRSSDSAENAAIEIAYFFKPEEIVG